MKLTTIDASGVSVSAGTRRLIDNSIAPATRRAYASALAAVDSACASPLTDAVFADHLASRFDAGAGAATLRMAVAAVNFRSRLANSTSPAGALTTRVMAGVNRKSPPPQQVAGIQFAQADSMAALAAADGSLRGQMQCALVLVASDAMLRASEMVAIDVGDFDFSGDNGCGTLTIPRSKTDQTGTVSPALHLRARTCRAIRRWLTAAGINGGPAFRAVSIAGRVSPRRISIRTVRNIIISLATAAGVDGRVSPHSFRVGSAQSLCALGASTTAMAVCGRWKDTRMPAHYSRHQAAATSAMATLRPA